MMLFPGMECDFILNSWWTFGCSACGKRLFQRGKVDFHREKFFQGEQT